MTDAISSILSQIRAHEMRAGGLRGDVAPSDAIDVGGAGKAQQVPGFAETLSNTLDKVSATQARAADLQQAFELGDPRADLARVMVAMQQSQVAFRATVEVRNRLVSAYQEVMNMPI